MTAHLVTCPALFFRELQGMNSMLLGKDFIVKGLQEQIGSFLERDFSQVKVDELCTT